MAVALGVTRPLVRRPFFLWHTQVEPDAFPPSPPPPILEHCRDVAVDVRQARRRCVVVVSFLLFSVFSLSRGCSVTRRLVVLMILVILIASVMWVVLGSGGKAYRCGKGHRREFF